MKINFQVKKHEFEWQKIVDNFWLNFAPRWFNWLGWVIIIGAITYLNEKSESIFLTVTIIISYIALFFYFQGFFYSIEFHGIPFIKNEKIRRVISLLISSILATGIYVFFTNLILEFKR